MALKKKMMNENQQTFFIDVNIFTMHARMIFTFKI